MKFIVLVMEMWKMLYYHMQEPAYLIQYGICIKHLFFPLGNKKNVQYRSVISDIFDGKILSSVQCLTCERVRKGILAHY